MKAPARAGNFILLIVLSSENRVPSMEQCSVIFLNIPFRPFFVASTFFKGIFLLLCESVFFFLLVVKSHVRLLNVQDKSDNLPLHPTAPPPPSPAKAIKSSETKVILSS